MTPTDLCTLFVVAFAVGMACGIATTLLYLRQNLHLRSQREWEVAIVDDELKRIRQASGEEGL